MQKIRHPRQFQLGAFKSSLPPRPVDPHQGGPPIFASNIRGALKDERMLKTILASLTGFGSDRTVLDAAFALASLDTGHVAALHARIDPGETAGALGVMEPQLRSELLDTMQRIAREEQEHSAQARLAFADARKRHGVAVETPGDGISASYREMTAFENETIHQARLHDMVVMARVPELAAERLHTLVMLAGKPVLIPAHRPAQAIGESVAVAWKDSAEAARAVSAALPVLEHAKRVVVVTISEETARTGREQPSADGVVRQLKQHGVDTRLEVVPAGHASAAERIKELCYAADIDLLVTGAYGHSRMREMIFGGVTRHLLEHCDIPVLMVH
jgi:nucleotide-binding universal stress UspA family protein